MGYGRYFEELQPGQSFRHWPGRTITEFDDTLFSLLSMNQHPVHLDEHYAKSTQHGRRLVAGPVVISIALGLSQGDVGGRALETREYSEIRHVAPVFHGDSIYAESEVVEALVLENRCGLVTVNLKAVNQREETILTMQQRIVLPMRPEGGGRWPS